MDSKADGEEIIYPYLCFSVDNFDEAFEDIQVNHSSVLVQTTETDMVQTSDGTKVGQCKRQTGTNFGLVQTSDWDKRRTSRNVRWYKRQMVQRSDSTNVGLVQISDRYKRRTGINVVPAETSVGYVGLWLSLKKTIVVRNKFKIIHLL